MALVGGRNPQRSQWAATAGRLSPKDGANTELVTLEVCIPEGWLSAKVARKSKHAGAGKRGGRQPSRTGEEQTTAEG